MTGISSRISKLPATATGRGATSAAFAAHRTVPWVTRSVDVPGLGCTVRAFLWSRLLVWGAGAVAFLLLGTASGAVSAFDPGRLSLSFGHIGGVLAAPSVRWDSIWYLHIAHDGYRSAIETRFFPLYPLAIRVGSWFTGSPVLAGVLISLVAMFVGLEIIRRLTELELGSAPANATVLLLAFGPLALFLTAVYTESMFIALSAATFYAARRGRWTWAGILGGLAGMTRIGGFLLLAPVLLMFFFGPRSDAPPSATPAHRWQPRYPFTPAILWSILIPVGATLVPAYMMLRGLGSAATLHAQEQYSGHEIVLPIVGMWGGVVAAWHQLSGTASATDSGQALLQLGALTLGCIALVGVFRRLPPAYGVYVALGFLLHLSSPTIGDPLRGFDRYASIRFPLFMWLAAWAVERRAVRPILVASGVLLVFFTCQFATWHWVGTPKL